MNRIIAIKNRLTHALRVLLFTGLATAVTVSEAALLDLADSPPYLITAVQPNIILTFDDSGSMTWGFLPDAVGSTWQDARVGCSSTVNRIFYDPTITYTPPVKEDNTLLNATPSIFTAAYPNGFNPGAGTVNLGTGYQVTWDPINVVANTLTNCGGAAAGGAAYYYLYNSALGGCSPITTATQETNACYTMVVVSATSGPGATDERLNFANWYSYYNTRNKLAKTAAGRAFARFGNNVRIAGHHLHGTGASTGANAVLFGGTLPAGSVRPFTKTPVDNRTAFFDMLYDSPADGNTPLREATDRAGAYLQTADPYLDTPGTAFNVTTNPERGCRQNYHILMTDGFWNGPGNHTVTNNADGTAITALPLTGFIPAPPLLLADPVTYTPIRPYNDGFLGTLADQAFFYWATDLRPALPNKVPFHYPVRSGTVSENYWNPVNDPATWQHMVNFTIGLGIPGTLTKDTATYDRLRGVTGPAIDWPNPITNTQGPRIDDLWHAAINSRGQYFSAGNPNELVTAFTSIVSNIEDRDSSASAVALNSSSLTGSNFAYQAKFNGGDWTGQLLAYSINASTGLISPTSSWDAAVLLNGQHFDSGRQIITYQPSTRNGIPFRLSSLDISQSTALNLNPITAVADAPSQAQARLNYLRGDATYEGAIPPPPPAPATPSFRVRPRTCGITPCPAGTNTGVLGDIINSSPLYIGPPPFDYPASFETPSYPAFRTANETRTPILYVGANDGMLHAFNASTGAERFAYVPGKVYSNLSRLAHTPYAHKAFVDGSAMAGDVVIGGAWKTILVSTLRKGGQGVFALDITDPSNFTAAETNANNLVLWEFTDANDADLGYTYGEPSIVRMHNGKWAVIFGNGYNNSENDGAASTTGRAVLYVLVISDYTKANGWQLGTNYFKLTTGAGSVTTPNGLAAPAAVDNNGDNIVDQIYAGDLQGNMWRFDVTSSNAGTWDSVGNRKLVFPAGSTQPITERPQVRNHPAGQFGNVVYFGTGKYLENTDSSIVGATTQTFYGIWDESGVANPVKNNLLQQTVLASSTTQFRVTSNNTMVWRAGSPVPNPSYIGWYMDLPDPGERQVTNPVLRGDRIIFTTTIPSPDPCDVGGSGWLMELKASSGSRLDITAFDTFPDGIFDVQDLIAGLPASGQKFAGVPSSPVVQTGGNPAATPACTGARCREQKFIGSSSGNINNPVENPDTCNYCRSSWRHIK